jgi:eukaryotic-like serine/threonine-protein kinase
MIGTNLAHYRITGHLGTGGMGEVYQATDSKLGRSVAIKLLPEAVSHDNDWSARFEREARVLASVNHPNVASIYGVEEFSGRKFLIMELIDGETLAERISNGPMPLKEALEIAIQITHAMDAAHEKGIVHRDLKPANIKITPDGNVKVLDFGLAKALESQAESAHLSASPTLSMAATREGLILGTAAYMSPEQAKNRAVDRRTDIFAFGAVLYEMLTGRRAFDGEDVTDILSSILKTEPDWARLPVEVPPAIHTVLRLCLQKDAKKRRQTATDVRIDIENALHEPVSTATKVVPVGRPRERIAFAVVALALIAAVALLAARYFAPAPAPPIASRFLIEIPVEAALLPGTVASPFPTVSPDGRYIVYEALSGGSVRLWLRAIGSLTSQPIPGTDGISPANSNPFWSANSDYIGFFAGGKLKKVAVAGGPPQVLCDASGDSIAGTWNPDNVVLFESSGSINRVGGAGGIPAVVRGLDKSNSSVTYKYPYFLPDGRHFLYVATGPNPQVHVGDLDGKDDRTLFATTSRVLFATPNQLLFIRDGTLMAQPFDTKKLAVVGDAVPVAEQVAANPTNGSAAVSVSKNGTLVYRSGDSAAAIELTKFDRSGKPLGAVRTNYSFLHPRLSPDKNSLVVERREGGAGDIWLIDLLRGTSTRLTSDPGDDS